MEKNYEFLEDFDPNDIEIATQGGEKGKWTNILCEWMETDSKTLKFSLKSQDEKRLCRAAISQYIRKHGLDYTIYNEKNKFNIYVVRS